MERFVFWKLCFSSKLNSVFFLKSLFFFNLAFLQNLIFFFFANIVFSKSCFFIFKFAFSIPERCPDLIVSDGPTAFQTPFLYLWMRIQDLNFEKKFVYLRVVLGQRQSQKKLCFFAMDIQCHCITHCIKNKSLFGESRNSFRRVAQLVSASCATRSGELRNSFRRVAQLVSARLSCATRIP